MDEKSIADIANENVSIIDAMRAIGMDTAYAGYSGKQYCPFGDLRHSDAGTSKAFRVYLETNSCFCFAGCGYYNPVMLVQDGLDLTAQQAAEMLLLRTGWSPETYESRWETLQANEGPQIDTGALADALKLFCSRRVDDWEFAQLTGSIATTLDKCLGLLTKVTTPQEAQVWLDTTKTAMRTIIEREGHV